MYAWSVIGYLVTIGALPAPMVVAIEGKRLDIKLRFRSHVDQWATHLNMPAAKVLDVVGAEQYGSMDFRKDSGWCGAESLYLYTHDGAMR